VAGGDLDGARGASAELGQLAEAADAALLRAMADHATGSVSLACSDAAAALVPLRRACRSWRDLGMPYDAARARVQIAVACRALGDHDAATLELDAARAAFERLGAAPDVARVAQLAEAAPSSSSPEPPPGSSAPSGVLTDRECEVLRLVAKGRTNREIAAALFISEHTVARHLQNMFVKLGLSSRAAATAYAYEHDLI
jgi:DNA-binding CsgD family transcriptional regulator